MVVGGVVAKENKRWHNSASKNTLNPNEIYRLDEDLTINGWNKKLEMNENIVGSYEAVKIFVNVTRRLMAEANIFTNFLPLFNFSAFLNIFLSIVFLFFYIHYFFYYFSKKKDFKTIIFF